MKIDKDTAKFFSLSSNPGNFGATIYNFLFEHYKLNAIYVPLGLPLEKRRSFAHVMSSLHALGAHGVSISMPYKKEAARISQAECQVLNVNTMVPRETGWKSYNTDTEGFHVACKDIIDLQPNGAHIAGYGCVAHSIGLVLNKNKIDYKMFSVRDGMDTDLKAEWLINATPVGMHGVEDKLFTKSVLQRYDYIFDCVVSPPGKNTKLIETAKSLNKRYVPGYKMATYQLIAQFLLYAKNWRLDIDEPHQVRDIVIQKVKDMGYEI